MKTIEIDDELYQYIVSNTQAIGESASSILRRLLALSEVDNAANVQKVTIDSVKPEESVEIQDEPVSSSEPNHLAEETSQVAKPNTQESVFNFINKEELAMQRGVVGRFLLVLAALYRANPDTFSVVTEICGRDRLYFANSEAELAASGSSIKPKQIPESPFWVMTNSNTTRKKMMLTKAATSLGYSVEEVEKIRELL